MQRDLPHSPEYHVPDALSTHRRHSTTLTVSIMAPSATPATAATAAAMAASTRAQLRCRWWKAARGRWRAALKVAPRPH
ncbi:MULTISPECIES: hypothetical protein [Actinotignum]|uniref:Uncharacterized protein n=1 Tax=Actinotignum timonense TaxID=1870995 RepID=A0ABU5GEG1_9ACTO|nr:hypothetical protein [Actinotignum timonense]MDY5146982.1 hypothetical protein [Actinotignum timonense]